MTLRHTLRTTGLTLAAGVVSAGMASADIVHLDDVIIDFSLCVGNDCVNGENFGFDTLRLKENNVRMHFLDTSNSASFPQNDWRLIANDSSNGGANYFAIEDSTAGSIPFRVEAGAPVNTLYVEADGDVGIKIANPVVDLHIVEGNTPTVRLEQDGSDGFQPQTYDLAANESNFFIRDVTNGSKLFFRAQPNAPADSIFIAADGDIGLGTASPDNRLHTIGGAIFDQTDGGAGGTETILVRRADSTAKLLIQDTGAAFNTQVELIKAGTPRIRFDDSTVNAAPVSGGTNLAAEWDIGLDGSQNFLMRSIAQNNNAFTLADNGNLTITGSLTTATQVLPDYVFEADYDLMPLYEVEKFIIDNGHLPKIPPAAEVIANGLNITEMQVSLLEKVEELTLYTLAQQKTIDALKAKLELD